MAECAPASAACNGVVPLASAAFLGDVNINLAVQPALTACFQFLSDSRRQAAFSASSQSP